MMSLSSSETSLEYPCQNWRTLKWLRGGRKVASVLSWVMHAMWREAMEGRSCWCRKGLYSIARSIVDSCRARV